MDENLTQAQRPTRGVIIVAAGRGTRMGEDKVWLPLGGMPVVAYSVRAFAGLPSVSRLILVVSRDNRQRARDLLSGLGVAGEVCLGGERRQDSVVNGLRQAEGVDLIAIHDGARPLVSARLIEACYEEAERCGAALAAIQIRDTLKRATESGWAVETVDRRALWAAQTPQVFRRELICQAYAGLDNEVTDDAAAVERLGRQVRIVVGDQANLKLTTRADLLLARALLGLPGREGES